MNKKHIVIDDKAFNGLKVESKLRQKNKEAGARDIGGIATEYILEKLSEATIIIPGDDKTTKRGSLCYIDGTEVPRDHFPDLVKEDKNNIIEHLKKD